MRLRGEMYIATSRSVSVPIRITIQIQEFLTEFYHSEMGPVLRILLDQLPWQTFAIFECF